MKGMMGRRNRWEEGEGREGEGVEVGVSVCVGGGVAQRK